MSLRDLAHEGPWGRGLGMPVYEHLLDRMQEGFERRLAAAVDALEAGHGAGALRGASLLAYLHPSVMSELYVRRSRDRYQMMPAIPPGNVVLPMPGGLDVRLISDQQWARLRISAMGTDGDLGPRYRVVAECLARCSQVDFAREVVLRYDVWPRSDQFQPQPSAVGHLERFDRLQADMRRVHAEVQRLERGQPHGQQASGTLTSTRALRDHLRRQIAEVIDRDHEEQTGRQRRWHPGDDMAVNVRMTTNVTDQNGDVLTPETLRAAVDALSRQDHAPLQASAPHWPTPAPRPRAAPRRTPVWAWDR